MDGVKIYATLSLDAATLKAHLPGAVLEKPVKRGDLLADIRSGVKVVGIVDGEFAQSLAVTPSEIMDALRCGLKVYGSSSIGALRAAEVAPYGMIGVGRVYQHIVATPYFADDALGMLFYEGIEQATLPFIDLAFGVEDLVRRGRLSAREAKWLVKTYRGTHFSERSLDSLLAAARKHFAARRMTTLQRYINNLGRHAALQKRRDALDLVETIRNDLKRQRTLQQLLDAA